MDSQELEANEQELEQEPGPEEKENAWAQYAVARFAEGADRETIVSELVEQDADRATAQEMADSIQAMLLKESERGVITGSSLVKGFIGGLVAAVIAGLIWAGVTITTDHEIGIVAWLIGLIAGIGVSVASGGKRGIIFQLMAVCSSLLGILIGKYYTTFHYINQAIEAGEEGFEEMAQLSLISLDMIVIFAFSLPKMVGGYDLLWVALAFYTCWKMLKFSGIKLSPEAQAQPFIDSAPLGPS